MDNCWYIKNISDPRPESYKASPSSIKIGEEITNWSEKEKNIFREQWLLDTDRIILKKVPYKFYYKYYCSSEFCRSHTQHIEDWEIVGAYWNYIKKYGTEKNALEMLQKKFEGELCSEKKDLYFIVGRHSTYSSWMIIGLWYPKNNTPNVINGQKTLWSINS